MRVNADFGAIVTVQFNAANYIRSPSFGVNRFVLDRIGKERARATTIVEYTPNTTFPAHTHIGGEEFLVLSGTFRDEHGVYPTGTYVRNPIGTSHSPFVENDGCTIFVKLLQMARRSSGKSSDESSSTPTEEAEQKSLHIDTNDSSKSTPPRVATEYGTVVELYKNSHELVEMCWIQPNKLFNCGDDDDSTGGEELLVVNGSVLYDGTTTFTTWDWLRFPPSQQQRPSIKAGENGAQLYRKTKHLTTQALAMEMASELVVDTSDK